MNKKIKGILIIINTIMIALSIKWYLKNDEEEPLISLLGQFSALIVIIFENKINSIINANKNTQSAIEVDVKQGDKVNINKNKNSDIKIKTN